MKATFFVAGALVALATGAGYGANDADRQDCKQDKDHDRRIAGCSSVLQDPSESAATRAVALVNRGSAYSEKRAYESAFADFDAALAINPTFASAFAGRCVTFRRKDEFDPAMAACDQALRLDPSSTTTYLARAILFLVKKEYDRALQDLNEAVRIDPKFADGFRYRSVAYSGKNDLDRAIESLSTAMKIQPNPTDYLNRGGFYRKQKQFDRAIADYSLLIKNHPDWASLAYGDRALAYNDKGDYDRAIADLSKAIESRPTAAYLYRNRAIVYQNKRSYDRAIADFNKVLEIAPDFAGVREERDRAVQQKAAAAATDTRSRHYVLNGTAMFMNVMDNRKIVCALKAEQDCWWVATPGQHIIELVRGDGRSLSKTVTVSQDTKRGVIHDVICPKDFGVTEQAVPSCR
jgi:tetratricopeptide (TPR) repeat protein